MRALASILLLALATLAACDGMESEDAVAPDATAATEQTCKQFVGHPDEPAIEHEVPSSLASYVSATKTTITVQRSTGTPACLDVSYGDVDAWDSLAKGRLLGVGISGHEYNSYLVVDLEGTGEPIETGRAPTFSPSGRRFASVDVSEAAFGAFEALGVWEVTNERVRRLMYFPGAPLLDTGGDWRLERWHSDDCVVFSSAKSMSSEPEDRNVFELVVTGEQHLRGPLAADAACRSPA